jgi:RNA polymerase sigma-70 factor (ECF subfamily)
MDPAVRAEAEAQLSAAFRSGLAGDTTAYRRFLDELSLRLRAFLRRRLASSPDDVEDVLQETLLAIHNGRHTWDARQPLTPWIYAITRYKLVDFARSRSRRDAFNVPLDGMEELLGETDGEPMQARCDIGRLLGQLPDHHRLPILYVKVQGLSVRETARLTGMSESAVKVGVHRGLKALALTIREAS